MATTVSATQCRALFVNKAVFALLLSLAAVGASAQGVAIHGWIDGYSAWNDERPDSRLNFFDGVGTTAHRSDQVALNVAALEFVREPKPFGFHVILVSGDSTDIVHMFENHPNDRLIRNVFQASVTYTAPVGRGLGLEAGIYPTEMMDTFFSKNNWNYTRGWLGELAPYYETGIKASYAWSDRWSGQLHLMRGWGRIEDNNSALAYGTQIKYDVKRWSVLFNTFVGPELPDDNVHLRKFGDLMFMFYPTPKLAVGTSIDRGRQEMGDDMPAANWLGVSAYGRYAFDDRHAFAVRGERFRDPDGMASGFAQTLTEATLTYELRPTRHFIFKLEGRRDHSTAPMFNGSRNQTLAIASGVAVF